ncbi:Zinc finger, U1-type [Moelleriella libera RCEF 2490]|uniref:Zinc finger, U1-type n=1 Tax=Moelleriella libera RCEF 2490 TaxID=1081109 RepID=A0A168D545_9HYPO|nr:Zinc finger, U1-type [Moelleriella libera RCEF 2490]
MADARSLLRQQRAARRIEHPHAAYSDAGKLLCTLCREQLKAESQWDAHLLGQKHRQKVQQKHKGLTFTEANAANPGGGGSGDNKRKLHHIDTTPSTDADHVRPKRSRPDMTIASPEKDSPPPRNNGSAVDSVAGSLVRRRSSSSTTTTITTPTTTGTPSHGVELRIPSRPATPAHQRGDAANSYFSAAVAAERGPAPSSSTSSSQAAVATSAPASTTNTATVTATGTFATTTGGVTAAAANVDESEWAAFEADIAAASAPFDPDAVISAPAMTAEQVSAAAAAAAEADEEGRRKAQADVDIEDEKKEAARALQQEFDEMRDLEERLRRLKEERERILSQRRRRSSAVPRAPSQQEQEQGADKPAQDQEQDARTNGVHGGQAVQPLRKDHQDQQQGQSFTKDGGANDRGDDNDDDDNDDDDDGDDDDDDDNWASFRFKRT